ncbi:hypothetical protein [Allokutzneria sp. NRRL B-24872]|uniref:hypothetical protein n=1 Tax=Allokutzneria sp. NRRL B-24872 TaxID=1137961 RepID=UPI0011780A72|nr:hypothetical protein [Allokutzneria sp. NRRL B-24872]
MVVFSAARARAAALPLSWRRPAVHTTWVLLLSGWAVARIGRFGFHPTDQGFTLALSWRLLHGEVPHRDVVSARPLASALLHTLDFAVPGPLFLVSAMIAMVQLVVATIALATLVTGRAVLSWGPLGTGLVAAAALVNLHTFPLMAWHTIDGIFLVACGWWALRSGLRTGAALPRYGGLFLVGMAAFTKQSFVFAAALTVTYLLARHSLSFLDIWWTGAFPLGYIGFVSLAGGFTPMVEQLSGATGAWPRRAFTVWESPEAMTTMLWLASAAVALILLRRKETVTIPAVIASAVALLVVLKGDMLRAGDWGMVLLWALLFVVVARWMIDVRAPRGAVAVVALAAMSSLSWGYDSPTLLGGTLALSVLWLLTPELPRCSPRPVGGVAVAAVVLLGTSKLLVDAHDASPYRDRPQHELTASLGLIAPALNGLRTTPEMYSYVAQIEECVREHPARRVAVLPDNAFAYPALGLRNPFPLDWPLPLELVGDARERMLATVPKLNADGDYLVLFQEVGHTDLEGRISAGLTGRRITCGQFTGVWARQPLATQ